MADLLLLFAAAFVRSVSGQLDNPSGYISTSNIQLCNESFAAANGTGIYYYNPGLPQGPGAGAYNETDGTTLPVSLAATIIAGEGDTTRTQYSFWLSTNGANYTDDLALGFDACGFVAGPFSTRMNALGARDNGSCTTMFDAACVGALESAAENYALQLTLAPALVTTLDSSSLPTVCSEIANKINANIPNECKSYFSNPDSSMSQTSFAASIALTGDGSRQVGYNESCAINGSYYHVVSITGVNNNVSVYDQLAYITAPTMIVYMPVANGERTTFITRSSAKMICAHITDFKEGSRRPPLPAIPSDGSSLSKGAIAGIVIGSLVGLAAVGCVLWTIWRKRRKARKQGHGRDGSSQNATLVEVDGMNSEVSQAPDGFSKSELNGSHYHVHEMRGLRSETPELAGNHHQSHELEGQSYYRHELPSSIEK